MSGHNPVSCPLCNGTSHFEVRAHDAFYGVTPYAADLYRCGHCLSLFQHPIPDRETIATFYPEGYWQEEKQPTTMTQLQQTYIRWMLQADLMRQVGRLKLPQGARYLDVGCSRGDWLALIREYGYQVSGIEADPRAAQYARDRHGIHVDEVDGDTWEPQLASYDAISFFHLLEHLRDPGNFLDKVYRALIPGGKILLRVPYVNSFQAHLLGKRWKGLEMPRHIILFSRKALENLLRDKGFEINHVTTWALRDGPPCLASSILPQGEPTWQEIHRKPSPLLTLLYLGLTWTLTPVEALAALAGKGSMITIIATRN